MATGILFLVAYNSRKEAYMQINKEQIHLEENTIQFSYIGREWKILRADMEVLWEKMVHDTSSLTSSTSSTNSTSSTSSSSSKGVCAKNTHDKNTQGKNARDKNSWDDFDGNINAHLNSNYTDDFYDEDERLPYWAELWPSSLALAKWLDLNRQDIEQKICMDLGCGLGFTALCGAYLGAHVMGADYEAGAIALAKENAAANGFEVVNLISLYSNAEATSKNENLAGLQAEFEKTEFEKAQVFELNQKPGLVHAEQTGSSVDSQVDKKESNNATCPENANVNTKVNCLDFRVMDWRAPCISKKSLDFVWAADIVYEKAFVIPVLEFLEYALKDTGKAWIAEPGRAIFEHFPHTLLSTSLKMQRVSSQETMALSAHIPKAHVNIWEIVRK